MKKSIAFFIKNPIWVNSLILLTILLGIYSYYNFNKSFMPETVVRQVNVSVFYPGASAQEIETGISIKIEQSLKGIEEIEEYRTNSSENFSSVYIYGTEQSDPEELLAEVENAINSINSFPQGAEKPIIRRIKTGSINKIVAWMSLSSNQGKIKLKQLAEKVENELQNSKVITNISKIGFPQNEIVVETPENKLLQYGLSFDEISRAITSKNIDLTVGTVKSNSEELIIRNNNKSIHVEDIKNITIRTNVNGRKILLKDVANVELKETETSYESNYNGKPAILFRIDKTPEQDLSAISKYLKKYIKKFNLNHKNASLKVQFDFNEMVESRINLLTENGLFGLLLVMICLGLFLNLRLSIWVAFGIPFSFLGMYFFGHFYGMTINMISLFGMIMVVGILVDDGIVIAENIYSHYEKGKKPLQAAIDGTVEVMSSVFTSVLTTMVAFGMLLFVEGMEMMKEMAFVVLACLFFSLIEAFLILPSHLSHEKALKNEQQSKFGSILGFAIISLGVFLIYLGVLMIPEEKNAINLLFPITLILVGTILFFTGYTKSPIEKKVRFITDKFINYIRFELFSSVVKTSIRKYTFFVWLPFLFLIIVIIMNAKGIIGSVLFPEIKQDQFTIEAEYKPGENKKQTKEFILLAEKIVKETNQEIIDLYGDTILKYYSSYLENSHTGSMRVFMNINSKTPPDTLMNRVDEKLKREPLVKLAQEVLVKASFSQFGSPINFILKSANQTELKEASEFITQTMNRIKGIKYVTDDMEKGKKEIHLELKPEAEIYQLTASEITKQIRQGFYGQEAQRVLIGTDEVKIWVRYPLEDRKSWENLENMNIKTPNGLAIPLKELTTYKIKRESSSIYRHNGERKIEIYADVFDANEIEKINKKIEKDIFSKAKTIYSSVDFEQQGQVKSNDETMNSIMMMVGIAIAIMIVILSLNFSSVYQAFLIVLVIPIGYAGAVLGHGIVGIPFSSLSAFGVLALLGVLVNDAVVFLDTYNRHLKGGLSVYQSAYKAAISRFRPILLTSITTVAGLLPLISETDFQAQFLIPMAVTIAFGILFGTIFILICYPAAILYGTRVRKIWFWFWYGKKLTAMKEAEPIYRRNK